MQPSESKKVSIVAWDLPQHIQFGVLQAQLQQHGFPAELLREMLPRNAFARIRQGLEREGQRIIRVVEEREDVLLVQFTKESHDTQQPDKPALRYDPETVISIEKRTGLITCEVPELVEKISNLMGEAKRVRSRSDVTRLLKKIFALGVGSNQTGGRLFPFNHQGYTYFVPHTDSAEDLLNRVDQLLVGLGGKLKRLVLQLDQGKNAEEILGLVDLEMEARIRDLELELEERDLSTPTKTLKGVVESRLEAVQLLYGQLDLFGSFLSEKANGLADRLATLRDKLTTTL